ncbi:hypothetical protein RugamoR64_23330 [Duganella rhizosphaerae]|uniref:hypothetical protein n=1 Tax=Duganella rhizosphaerae TaxID=2885763 RepID=UPI0030EA2542
MRNAARTSATLVVFAAQLGVASSAFAGVDSLVVGNDSSTISFLMYYSSTTSTTSRQLYIDTDRSNSSGFTIGGVGSEFFVADGNLYRYTGTGAYNWSWQLIAPVSFADDGSKAQWTIPRSLLTTAATFDIVGKVQGPNWQSAGAKQNYTINSDTPVLARDPYTWPFAQDSIWNMPIGSGAQYVPANLPLVPGNDPWANIPQADREKIVLKPSAPATPVYYSSAGWTAGANRCAPTGAQLTTVPIPADYIVANGNGNSSAAFLSADGRTIIQSQPLARCTAGGPATSQIALAPVDLYGPGITGAHGGSRMSAIGGTLRRGELRPGGQGPRHALKLNVYAAQVLYKCTDSAGHSDCYRWPAQTADSYAVGRYGTVNNGLVENGVPKTGGSYAMRMGALLAIPALQDINALGLKTEPARQLAWTLQNYGAYIVDDAWGASYAFNVEDGADGSFTDQFMTDWKYPFEATYQNKIDWMNDIQRLMTALYVVDNNSPTTIGGGGDPLQPLAPALPSLLPQR